MSTHGNIVSSRNWPLTTLLLFIFVTGSQAKKLSPPPLTPLTVAQAALIDEAAAREKVTIKELVKRTPMVQTYIQNMKPDAKLGTLPSSDHYILSRVDFGRTFRANGYRARPAKHGLLQQPIDSLRNLGVTLGFDMEYMPDGFMDMMLLDASSFDRQHYDFGFVRTEFLGAVRTQVFDVLPKKGTGNGRFSGRIWVEDEQGNVVRFNGLFSGNAKFDRVHYFHFDSWRTNLQPGVWLPAAIYVEETHGSDEEPDVKAQSTFWGYSLKLPTHESDNASIQIDNVTDESEAAQDVSPLEASRAWVAQAETNVLDRLVQAGLLAPPSPFDTVLETVTNNLIIGNNLQMPSAVHCRVLLTAPLESLALGNTILVSRGLIDVLPNEEDLAAVLSMQLAHITLGHNIDTRYAFNDRLLFPDEVTFQRITMNHSQNDDTAAVKKAIELLSNSVYRPQLPTAGLFFAQLQERSKQLKALLTPQLGDSLLRPDGSPWLLELAKNSPKLDQDNLDQIAALPLGSHLKVDEWSDMVAALHTRPLQLLNVRDKTPFEVTPVFYRLTRYSTAAPGAQVISSVPAPSKPSNP